jgi:hypothetical protein
LSFSFLLALPHLLLVDHAAYKSMRFAKRKCASNWRKWLIIQRAGCAGGSRSEPAGESGNQKVNGGHFGDEPKKSSTARTLAVELG